MALSQGELADDWICGFVPCRSGGVPRIQRKRKRPIYELCRQRRKPICLYIAFYLVRKPQKSPLTVSVGLIPLFCGLIYQKAGKIPGFRYPAVAAGGVVDIFLVAGGYFLCESFLYGPAGALASVPANLVQGVSGLIISLLLYPVLMAVPEVKQMAQTHQSL